MKTPCLASVADWLPFTVDTWNAASAGKHQFLSHAHKDHLEGFEEHARVVHCSEMTAKLVAIKVPRARAQMVALHPNEAHTMPSVSGGVPEYTVTLILPDNHCPGSVAFLFQGPGFGTILHTGDARLTPEAVDAARAHLHERAAGRLDVLYMDCTNGDSALVRGWARACALHVLRRQELPSIGESAAAVCEVIARRPDSVQVLLSCEQLGSEHIIQAVATAFQQRVCLPRGCPCDGEAGAPMRHRRGATCRRRWQTEALHREHAQVLHDLLLGEYITEEPRASRFHTIGGRQLDHLWRAECQAARQRGGAPPLIVRPSMQMITRHTATALGSGAPRCGAVQGPIAMEENGIVYVLHSRHSSRSELVHALQVHEERVAAAAATLQGLACAVCEWGVPCNPRAHWRAACLQVWQPKAAVAFCGRLPTGLPDARLQGWVDELGKCGKHLQRSRCSAHDDLAGGGSGGDMEHSGRHSGAAVFREAAVERQLSGRSALVADQANVRCAEDREMVTKRPRCEGATSCAHPVVLGPSEGGTRRSPAGAPRATPAASPAVAQLATPAAVAAVALTAARPVLAPLEQNLCNVSRTPDRTPLVACAGGALLLGSKPAGPALLVEGTALAGGSSGPPAAHLKLHTCAAATACGAPPCPGSSASAAAPLPPHAPSRSSRATWLAAPVSGGSNSVTSDTSWQGAWWRSFKREDDDPTLLGTLP